MVAFLLGLTGGIGSGKSTVGRWLVDLGACVVDADQLAREIVAPGQPALAEIVARWGEGVLLSDGSLNRPALASIVFADPEERRALEAMTHPRIIAESDRILAESRRTIGVHMAALLLEAGAADRCDAIWLVTAPEQVRIRRVMERDGVAEGAVRARMAHQWSDARKEALVDLVLDTDAPEAVVKQRVEAAYLVLREAVAAGVNPYRAST